MKVLKEIIALSKGSVSININEHRDCYETVKEYIKNISIAEGLPMDILDEMEERDTCIEVFAYPNTPVSFHYVAHYDLDTALDLMSKLIKE